MNTTDQPRKLLAGQAAAPDGPADLSMMYVLHHGFRRDLARFGAASRRTPVDEAGTWSALLERWDLFALLLHDHHHKEDDVLWPLLRDKVEATNDTAAAAVLDEMEAEHATIDPLLAAVRNGLVSMLEDPSSDLRDELADTLDRARTELDAHLGHEERDAIAILQKYVGGEEWAHLERTRFRGGLSPRDLLRMLPWSVQGLPGDVVRPLLAEAGLPFRVLLRLGRKRFEQLDAPAFVHVPASVGAASGRQRA